MNRIEVFKIPDPAEAAKIQANAAQPKKGGFGRVILWIIIIFGIIFILYQFYG